jgi:septum formation protein
MSFSPIILASTSVYRKMLLQRLFADFECCPPDCAEVAQADETPQDLALRLSITKARSLTARYPDAIIIGSDQTACCGTTFLEKPGSNEQAARQLALCSGNCVSFHTGLAVINSRTGTLQSSVVSTHVFFRHLNTAQIMRYIEREKPLDCSGSFKAESLGISLFTRICSDDPTAIVGLPLICLTDFLHNEGLQIP